MSRKKFPVWRYVYILLIFLYILSLYFSIIAINRIPDEYKKIQEDKVIKLQSKIKKGIEENDIEAFKNIANENAVEFFIFDNSNNEVLFSTIPAENIVPLKNSLNEKAIVAEKVITYTINDINYDIWLVQYNISPQEIVNIWLTRVLSIIFSLIFINVIAMIILYLKFIQPLRKIKANIDKISKYQLDILPDNTDNEYNQISAELVSFAKDLKENIQKSKVNYSMLEKKLQIQNERLTHRNKVLARLTHDLKTPLVNAYMGIENEKIIATNKTQMDMLIRSQKQIEKTIEKINDIGRIAYSENDLQFTKKETFDVIELLMEIYTLFIPQFKKNNFTVKVDVDEKVIVNSIKMSLRHIISNAMSNISNYGKHGGDVVIKCHIKENKWYMSFYNDCLPLSDKEIENAFKLFHRLNEDNIYGLGTGLYTIKATTNELEGTVSLENYGNGIIIKLEFDV